MKMQQFNSLLIASLIGLSLGGLWGCQPQEQANSAEIHQHKQDAIPLIQAKTVAVQGARNLSCAKEGCTRFDLQGIHSNVSWIDHYFQERLQRAEPVAFQPQDDQQAAAPELHHLEQRSMQVSFLGQRYDLATFVIKSYSFKTGAEHGMLHTEYVNLDLSQKKRIALDDILKSGVEQQLLDTVYASNLVWLNSHGILKEQLKLSDNFYFGADGLVLVYPVDELADYSVGMPELKIPYSELAQLVKPEYLSMLAVTKP